MRHPGHSQGGSLDASNDGSYRQSLQVTDHISTMTHPPSFASPVSLSENSQSTRVGPSGPSQARDGKRDSMSSLEVSYSIATIGRLTVVNPDLPLPALNDLVPHSQHHSYSDLPNSTGTRHSDRYRTMPSANHNFFRPFLLIHILFNKEY